MPSDYEEAYRQRHNEAADCVVQALAAVTGHSYLEVHETLQIAGRVNATATSRDKTRAALRHLGFEIRRVWTKEQIALEVKAKEPTLADLEGKGWLPRMVVMVNKHDHIAPFWDGKVRDWSANTEAMIDEAWEISKIGVPARAKTPPVIYLGKPS